MKPLMDYIFLLLDKTKPPKIIFRLSNVFQKPFQKLRAIRFTRMVMDDNAMIGVLDHFNEGSRPASLAAGILFPTISE